jgi:hypothetical protein
VNHFRSYLGFVAAVLTFRTVRLDCAGPQPYYSLAATPSGISGSLFIALLVIWILKIPNHALSGPAPPEAELRSDITIYIVVIRHTIK